MLYLVYETFNVRYVITLYIRHMDRTFTVTMYKYFVGIMFVIPDG